MPNAEGAQCEQLPETRKPSFVAKSEHTFYCTKSLRHAPAHLVTYESSEVSLNMGRSDEHYEGPDQVIPASKFTAFERTAAVKLKLDTEGAGARTPISVPGLLAQAALDAGDLPALRVRDPETNNEKTWTWFQYHEEVRVMAKAFINIGLNRFESVCILGYNAPEWSIADLAAIFAGGFAAGIYPTNGPEACKYILQDSHCSILVVEDQKQLDKVWSLRQEVPSLKKIIQYAGIPNHPGVLSWKDVMAEGRALPDDELDSRLRRIAINQCCTLVYTSGTTGVPKGVMLSHDNVTWTAQMAVNIHKWEQRSARVLSYLPLSHVAANLADIHAVMAARGATYFADKDALKGSLKENLLWCRPTHFLAVPRVWEKIMEKMLETGRTTKGIKKEIAVVAKQAALKYHLQGKGRGQFNLFQALVFNKVKAALGLDQCVRFYSGAAPLSREAFDYFLSLDIKIHELYGMSESSGPHTFQSGDHFRLRSVGYLIPSAQSRLVETGDSDMGDRKELWMRGRHIMMGYLNREDANSKEMTEEGWLKTGDLVEIDDEGYHFIVGREKDLIITAGGENVAPQPIQERINKELPVISQALLIGDRQKFLSCLLTLSVTVDPETQEPTNQLSEGAKAWCQSIGSRATSVEDILRRPDRKVLAAIQAGLDRVNREATSNAQRIQKWMILPKDFSLPGGEMGPTMKVKRNEVTRKYQRNIDQIYGLNTTAVSPPQNGHAKV